MIKDKLKEVLADLPEGVQLVAVSKYHPMEAVQEAYDAGQRVFGESIEKDLCAKYETLPKDIQWHFIGHLQTNKVKYIAPFISMIESVDSERLLKEIDKQAAKYGRTINVLLELHIAQEETKSGMTPEEAKRLLEKIEEYSHVRVCGIMMMATNTDDETEIANEFDKAAEFCSHYPELLKVRSWGMSADYKIAIKHGANTVRVGSKIFN